MITLSQAIKLTEEAIHHGVYLRRLGYEGVFFELKTIKEEADIEQIEVKKIGFAPTSREYRYLEFIVSGYGVDELLRRRH